MTFDVDEIMEQIDDFREKYFDDRLLKAIKNGEKYDVAVFAMFECIGWFLMEKHNGDREAVANDIKMISEAYVFDYQEPRNLDV